MKIRPLYDRIVVKRIEDSAEKTASGLFIPDSAKEKPQEGEVMAVGQGKRADDGKLIALDVKAGDRILFGKYSGSEIKLDGEEFLIILPGTDRNGAQACAERVRARTEAAAFPGTTRVTVTVGVATYARKEPVSALLARADKALYEGKSSGRNCVVTIG